MRVLYVQYTSPGAYPPLVRGARLLAESGAEVCMMGTRVRGLDALDAPPTPGVTVKLTAAPTDGWRLKAHYARYAAWTTREGASWRPDWIYASDLLSAPVALAVAAVTGARVVYHEHDAPSPAHESWTIRRCLDARRRLLRQADLIITPNAERSARLSTLAGGRSVLTVWNCPLRPEREPLHSTEERELRVVFRGSINADRLPETIVQALVQVGAQLYVAGYETHGSRGYVTHLMTLAESLGVADRVRMLGTVPEEKLAAICEQCDAGFALMPVESLDENMRHMTGASNKVFQYLLHGLMPLVSDLPDWRATFVEPGYALACDPRHPESIARALTWIARHRADARAMAARGWERLRSDWNYETQFTPVLRAMWAGRDRPSPVLITTADAHAEAPCAS